VTPRRGAGGSHGAPAVSTGSQVDPSSVRAERAPPGNLPEAGPEAEGGPPGARLRSLVALLTGTALVRVAAAGVTVAVQYYLTDLGHGRPHGVLIGAVGSAQALTEMVLAPFMARGADRFGRRTFLVLGPLVGALAVGLLAASVDARQIFGARLLEGVAAAAFVPTALGTIAAATSHSVRVRANASGAFEAATLVGYAGGFGLGPIAYDALGRGAFLVLAAAYLLAGLVCLALVPRVRPLPLTPVSVLIDWVTGPGPMRSFLPAWLGTFGLLGAYGANAASLISHHHARVPGQTLVGGLAPGQVSLVLVSGIVALIVGVVLWTPWIPRLGPVNQMRRAVPGVFVFSAALLAANHLPPVARLVLLPLSVVGIVWLAGFGPAAVAFLANSSESYHADRAALMSFYTATLAAGGAVGAFLGGAAVSLASLDGLVVFGALLAGMTLVMLRRVTRYERR
jgi:MFS family permease